MTVNNHSAPKWVLSKNTQDNLDGTASWKPIAVFTKEEKARKVVLDYVKSAWPNDQYHIFDRSYNKLGGVRQNIFELKAHRVPKFRWELLPLSPNSLDGLV